MQAVLLLHAHFFNALQPAHQRGEMAHLRKGLLPQRWVVQTSVFSDGSGVGFVRLVALACGNAAVLDAGGVEDADALLGLG
ncbi:MAG TPA: hypothetical protein VGW38_15575 [Chloroflexota bacterium]|nr:hypothetical protein [Chloroflexota bacterium]